MNFLRHSLLISLCFVAALCVGYAHSQASATMKFETSAWMESCGLNVEIQAGKPGVQYVAIGESRTRFNGFWPTQEGEYTWKRTEGEGDFVTDLEILKVKYEKVNGVIQPVSYYYQNLMHKEQVGHVIEKFCPALTEVH